MIAVLCSGGRVPVRVDRRVSQSPSGRLRTEPVTKVSRGVGGSLPPSSASSPVAQGPRSRSWIQPLYPGVYPGELVDDALQSAEVDPLTVAGTESRTDLVLEPTEATLDDVAAQVTARLEACLDGASGSAELACEDGIMEADAAGATVGAWSLVEPVVIAIPHGSFEASAVVAVELVQPDGQVRIDELTIEARFMPAIVDGGVSGVPLGIGGLPMRPRRAHCLHIGAYRLGSGY